MAGQGGVAPLRSDAARNRQRLLEAAAEVFATRGTSASLKDVADHAGLGVGTVYRHLPDKEAAIVALLRPQLEGLTALAEEALARPDPARAFVWLLEETSAVMAGSAALSEVIVDPGPVPDPLRGLVAEIIGLAGDLLVRAQSAGGIRADLVASDLPLILTAAHAIERTFGCRSPGVHRRILDLLIDGAMATPADRPSLTTPPLPLSVLLAEDEPSG